MDLSKKNLCPRLVDYVVFAGNRTPNASQNITRPQLLRRYPVADHKDFALPFEIAYFCQPEGNFTFKPKTSSDVRRTSSFTFTLTEKDTSKVRHGICYNFFRPARRSSTLVARNRKVSIDGFDSRFTLTSICLITHHPFLSTFRECLNVLHTVIDSCDFRAAKASGYRGQVWELLAGQIRAENVDAAVMREVREVETWIVRFLCAPVPVPGKTRLELDLLPLQTSHHIRFGFPDRTRFPLVDFPLHLPFELLGVDTGLRVLTCILLENKVLLRSKDVNAVSMCVMAYVAMLYPLEYMFPVIPLLPACMPSAEQLLLAPTPYIIGIPESFLSLKGELNVPDDVWLVDLDASRVYPPANGDELPPLPEAEGATLRSHIEQALHVMSHPDQDSGLNLQDEVVKNIHFGTQNADPSHSFPDVSPSAYGPDIAAVDVATRVAIVQFLNSPNVIGNLTEHIRTLRLYPRPVIAFQVYSFLKSRPLRSQFIDRFAKTQAVEFFAEWSLSPTNVAFLRAHTGISDPRVIGDKLKWFADQLQPIFFQVYDSNSTIGEAIAQSLNAEDQLHYTGQLSTDAADSDGDSPEADYQPAAMYDMDYARADFCYEIDVERLTYQMVCTDLEADFLRPPDGLQVPGSLISQSSSTQSIGDLNSDDDGSSHCSSPDDSRTNPSGPSDTGSDKRNGEPPSAEPKTPKPSLMNFRFGSSESNALQEIFGGNTNEQVAKLQNTMTDLKDKSKQNFQKATSLFKSLSAKDNVLETPLPLKISITGSDAANNTKDFVHDLATKLKKVGNSMDKSSVPEQQRPQPFGRRNPLERNTLIRHDNAPSPPERSGFHGLGQRTGRQDPAAHRAHSFARSSESSTLSSDNQNFLKEVIDGVMTGETVGWLKLNRLKRLLEDESYRNFLISRLNANLGKQMSDEQYIDDVMLSRDQWNGYAKLLQISLAGLEKSFQSWGLGGMGSTFQILEIAYTHYSDMKSGRSQSSASQFMNMFQRPTTPSVHSDTSSRIRPSESFGLNSDQLASGFRSVMNNVKTLTNNTTSILISSHEDDLLPTPLLPSPLASVATTSGLGRQAPGTPSEIGSVPSSPDTEGPDSPSLSRRSSQSTDGLTGGGASDVHRLTPEIFQPADDSRSFLDPERSPFASPNSSRRSSRTSDDGSSVGSGRITRKLISHQSITSFNTAPGLGARGATNEHDALAPESYSRKSSLSSEFRYRHGHLFPASAAVSPGMASTTLDDTNRVYLFESLLGKNHPKVFYQMQFWDDAFIDAVAIERDFIGMDQGPGELLERYKNLADADKKRMEHDEDRLLTTMLYNLIAFMVSVQVQKPELRKTARRLLGKCHLGLACSMEIHKMLDQLDILNGNEIDLKPPVSRQTQKQSFTVLNGTDSSGDISFMEVRDDGLVVRSINGVAVERIYYDNLINMTYSPKTKVLCLWHREKVVTEDYPGHMAEPAATPATATTKLNQYYCKKSKELYHCIKECMERAASRGKAPMPGADLGGDFPIQDMKTGEGGLLQVTMDGVGLLFANSKYFMQLSHIRKCFTQKGGIFVLEEYNADTQQVIQRKYKSPMADQICYSVLCLFSYIAAGTAGGKDPSPNRARFDTVGRSLNPESVFSDGKAETLTEITQVLNDVPSRIEAFVGIFRMADLKERIKSGTEEQYDRMKIFLTNISDLMKNVENAAAESARVKKRATDEANAEQNRVSQQIRKVAEEGRGGNDSDGEEERIIGGHVRLRVFSGNAGDAVDNWLTRFETVATSLDWTEQKRLKQAPLYLADGAPIVWLAKETGGGASLFASWKLFKDAIVKRFEPTDFKKTIRRMLHEKWFYPNGDVEEYYNDVIKLCY
ncbi:MAP kinase-activating death domain protein [Hypsibius exemplaris]|uniref:MAP kinase-activating death domain protein n=1 Tax=Hypsibius exemplaris TaxID=2072580 RepID=A0A1W0WHQ1_HYPEX|nr:MAP kinase-activating death domain protein [Hypsibius exemplaris]